MSKPALDTTTPVTRSQSSAKWVLGLLFAANLLNFYDRALPGVLLVPIKKEFLLNDTQVGILASAFVIVAAIAGVPLGRLADKVARRAVAGWGLMVWSIFTALGGLLPNFWPFFATRVGVGIGEASYDPATGSLIADLYPTERRARATSLFMLGFPIGTMLAYFTAGALATTFGTWRAPFLVAAVPGVLIAILIMRIREPRRGASDPLAAAPSVKLQSLRQVFRVRSVYGLILAFAGYNFAAYAIGTFMTGELQTYYHQTLVGAAAITGIIIGIGGLIGLIVGGKVLDRASKASNSRRVLIAAFCLLVAAPLSFAGLAAPVTMLGQFVLLVGLGYLLGTVYLAAAIPAVSDVVKPELRASALGVLYAIGYLIGGAGGPILVGIVSDSVTKAATGVSATVASANGLQYAMMILVPIGFLAAAIGMFISARSAKGDRERMLAEEAREAKEAVAQ